MLDHPIWAALTTTHRSLAIVHGRARRYPPSLARFAALEEPEPAAFADLRALAPSGDGIGLFTPEALDVPAGWRVVRRLTIEQMVCSEPPAPGPPVELVRLDARHGAEMLALAEATEPGPFKRDTVELGRYLGVRSPDGRLVAMAGERLRLPGYTEISGVCTDPAFRGRGYARALMVALMSSAFAEGQQPFLHVLHENGAKALYEQLGFRMRRALHLTGLVLA